MTSSKFALPELSMNRLSLLIAGRIGVEPEVAEVGEGAGARHADVRFEQTPPERDGMVGGQAGRRRWRNLGPRRSMKRGPRPGGEG
jgi:hypothetical protein